MASEAKKTDSQKKPKVESAHSSVRRKLFRALCWGGVVLLGIFAASNLWLWSAWGTGMVEAELKKRTGQDWEIGSISWSPWNGISLYDTAMLQPEELREALDQPVLKVDRVRVRPYWLQLVRGRVYPKSIEVDSPELTVSVEMLASIASRTGRTPAQGPVLTAPVRHPQSPGKKAPATAPVTQKSKQVKPTQKKPPVSGAKPASPQVDRGAPGLPLHVKISDAQLSFISVNKGIELVTFDGAALDLTMLGEDSEGSMHLRSLQIVGLPEVKDIQQKLVWKRPYLEIEEQVIELGGVEGRFIAQLGLGKNRLGKLPFLVDFVIDRQKVESAQWFEQIALIVDAQDLVARMRVSGLLHRLDTWRGDGMFAAEGFFVRERHGNRDVIFDEVFIPVIFRQGQFRWNSVRLMSEDLAIMGNGSLSVRDGHLSITRVVASPETAQVLRRGMSGAHIPGARRYWWKNLDTPDRRVMDLLVSGPLMEPQVDLGVQHDDLPLLPLIGKVMDFIRYEMKEAGKDMRPFPQLEFEKKKDQNS